MKCMSRSFPSRFIRYGLINREEAIKLVKEHDEFLDPLCVRDFCDFCDYSEKEFWNIVDRFYNKDIFKKNKAGKWKLINPLWGSDD